MDDLTAQRQQLRDAIWLHGPEHFDVTELYTGEIYPYASEPLPSGDWTACFIGHARLASLGDLDTCHLLGGYLDFTTLRCWRKITVAGWNPGAAYDRRRVDGEDDRTAQWHVAVEWLDRLIKGE